MENYGKKSGEEFQRELLRMSAGRAPDFSGELFAKMIKMTGKVAQVIENADTREITRPGGQNPVPEHTPERPDPLEVRRQFFEGLYQEFFCSGKYILPPELIRLKEFKDARVEWATYDDTENHPDKIHDAISRNKSLMIVLPSYHPNFKSGKWTSMCVPHENQRKICVFKDGAISKSWGIIGITYGLSLLQRESEIHLYDEVNDLDPLYAAVIDRLHVARLLSNDMYWQVIMSILTKNKIRTVGRLMEALRRRVISEKDVKRLLHMFKDVHSILNAGDKMMRETFIMESMVVAAARTESELSGGDRSEIELSRVGLKMLQSSAP